MTLVFIFLQKINHKKIQQKESHHKKKFINKDNKYKNYIGIGILVFVSKFDYFNLKPYRLLLNIVFN